MGETEQDLIMKLCGILCDLKYTGINFLYCFSVWFVCVCVVRITSTARENRTLLACLFLLHCYDIFMRLM